MIFSLYDIITVSNQAVRMLAFLLVASIFISSCLIPKRITPKNKPINNDLLNQLKPRKTYVFYFKQGTKEKVKIEKIDSLTIYGVVFSYHKLKKTSKPFQMSFDEVRNDIEKIIKKRSPEMQLGSGLLTISVLLITIYALGIFAVFWFFSLFI
jgi:hypothetical protein